MKQTAVVIFPGRGTYAKPELGYLSRFHKDKAPFLVQIDALRRAYDRIPVTELDAAKSYTAAKHATSENASALIYGCALADFAAIDRDKFDIVAMCGNSLGWYLSLAAAGALNAENAFRLVDTMGALMEDHGVGGQIVYPLVDEEWRPSEERLHAVEKALAAGARAGAAHWSIHLGGTAILAGDDAAIEAMEKVLPEAEGRYPFRLARHAAFHTPLMKPVSEMARAELTMENFLRPEKPIIDGRGVIWSPWSTATDALWDYTLGEQIIAPYSFSKSVEVAIKEFAPDKIILVGPGGTLGVPIAQELIRHRWLGMGSRADFTARQKEDPFLLAMGRDDQRNLVI